jgi:hypothetical protein
MREVPKAEVRDSFNRRKPEETVDHFCAKEDSILLKVDQYCHQ